jgi:microcystin-dependent protein
MSTIKTDKIEGLTDINKVEIPVGIEDVYLENLYDKSYDTDNVITPYDIITKRPVLDPRAFGVALNSTSLASAIASLGGAQGTIIIPPGAWSITGSLTFPSNVCVQVLDGGLFDVIGSLTFLGPILAGNYRIFTGAGSVSISTATPLVYDAWDGTSGNAITFKTIPKLPSTTPTNSLHAVSKGYVDSLSVSPPGVILAYAGGTAPTGFLLCNGVAISRITYASLYSVIGVTYGVGDGSTTFNLPDMKDRIPVGLSSNSPFTSLGNTGGEKTHVLTPTEFGSNNLHIDVQMGTYAIWYEGYPLTAAAHNNLQPYIVLNYIIKY